METIKTPFGKMQVVDEFVIQDDDKVTFCQKAREKYNELDKDGWFDSRSNEPYWYAFPYNRAKFTLCMSKSLGKVCFIDYRKEGKDVLFEARVFSHSSGFGLSGHYGYEEPEKEPLYIATETNEDDGELYFDEKGNTTEFETDAKKFTSEKDALEFAKNNVIFGEPGTKLLENMEKNTMKNKLFDRILNESNIVIESWRRETAERLIKEANKIDPSYSFVEYDIGPKKEIKHKILKNDNEYVGTFDVFTDEPYNSPYRYFFHHVKVDGLEFQGMNIDEFNKDFNEFIRLDRRVGHKALDESSLKENECSLEQLLSKAYVSEYKMVSENSAIVRVRTSPALLTSDSMAARFTEDIPDGYRLEVEYLGEDPVLGRNFDIYEVQLLKD